MTLGDVAATARFLTNADTNSYSDSQLLISINVWYQKVVSMIFESQDDSDFDDQRLTTYPVQTTPMVASQRDYSMPVSERVLKIKRVDVTYDGTNWYRARPLDDATPDFGLGNDTKTDQNFVKEEPRYDVKYNSIWLYPMPTASDVSAGGSVRVEWERNVQVFTTSDYTSVLTDSTVVPGFDAPFHPILAYGAAYEYAAAKSLPQLLQITEQLEDWETRLRTAYGRKELDTQLYLNSAYTSWDGR